MQALRTQIPQTLVNKTIAAAAVAATLIASGAALGDTDAPWPTRIGAADTLLSNDGLARLSGELRASNQFGLAPGGARLAYGRNLSDAIRIAAWNTTAPSSAAWGRSWNTPDASTIGIGLSRRFNDRFIGGVTLGVLNERPGALGSAYDTDSVSTPGAANRTYRFGSAAGFAVDRDNSVVFEAAVVATRAVTPGGLVGGLTDIQSRAYGVTWTSTNLVAGEGRLLVSAMQPLRVVSGQAALVAPTVDAQGAPRFVTEWTSLVPTGREIDYKLEYTMPIDKLRSFSVGTGYRKDVMNVSGATETRVGASWMLDF